MIHKLLLVIDKNQFTVLVSLLVQENEAKAYEIKTIYITSRSNIDWFWCLESVKTLYGLHI